LCASHNRGYLCGCVPVKLVRGRCIATRGVGGGVDRVDIVLLVDTHLIYCGGM